MCNNYTLTETQNLPQGFDPNLENKKNNTVIRIVHNRENPFVQLNKKALWDENLSLKAVGLWARCLSRPDNWKFSIAELVKKSKEGRRAIDGAMEELIKNNYVVRLEYYERGADGKFQAGMGGVEYVFFEFQATEEEKLEQLEIFKKSFRLCGFGDSRNGDSRNAHLLIKNKKEIEIKNKNKNIPSAHAVRLSSILLEIIKKNKPDFSASTNSWPKIFDGMLKTYTIERILDVMNYASTSDFWGKQVGIVSPNIIRNKFEMLETQMRAKKSESSTVPGIDNKVKWAKDLFKHINDESKFDVLSTYVEIKNKGHVYSVVFKEKDFKQLVLNHLDTTGVKYDEIFKKR